MTFHNYIYIPFLFITRSVLDSLLLLDDHLRISLFFLEVSVGQYLGVGGMSVVGQLAPIFKVISMSYFLTI